MIIFIQILLGLLVLICYLGGMNLLLKGTKSFLPEGAAPIPVLDNLFRFLSGIYFGLGFLMTWVLLHYAAAGDLIYFVGIVVIFSGLGRLYSWSKVGSAGRYFDIIMVVEICLGAAIILLQYLI